MRPKADTNGVYIRDSLSVRGPVERDVLDDHVGLCGVLRGHLDVRGADVLVEDVHLQTALVARLRDQARDEPLVRRVGVRVARLAKEVQERPWRE